MDIKKFKKEFDKSFAKMTPTDFINKMKNLGYSFEDIKTNKDMNTKSKYKR